MLLSQIHLLMFTFCTFQFLGHLVWSMALITFIKSSDIFILVIITYSSLKSSTYSTKENFLCQGPFVFFSLTFCFRNFFGAGIFCRRDFSVKRTLLSEGLFMKLHIFLFLWIFYLRSRDFFRDFFCRKDFICPWDFIVVGPGDF